uniref:SCAN box domain-containing protein n=1 Tax=Parastrongyloides trichosuri TaxID=131310 RepID=A0A0N4ZZP1_PARTI
QKRQAQPAQFLVKAGGEQAELGVLFQRWLDRRQGPDLPVLEPGLDLVGRLVMGQEEVDGQGFRQVEHGVEALAVVVGEGRRLEQGLHLQPVVQHEVEVAADDQGMGHAFRFPMRRGVRHVRPPVSTEDDPADARPGTERPCPARSGTAPARRFASSRRPGAARFARLADAGRDLPRVVGGGAAAGGLRRRAGRPADRRRPGGKAGREPAGHGNGAGRRPIDHRPGRRLPRPDRRGHPQPGAADVARAGVAAVLSVAGKTVQPPHDG